MELAAEPLSSEKIVNLDALKLVEARLLAALDGQVQALVQASIGLGLLEASLTSSTGPVPLDAVYVQVCACSR